MHVGRITLLLSLKFSLTRDELLKQGGSAASDFHVRRQVQEAGIGDGTTIPPASRSGNGNLSGGGDDLRASAWWLVPKGKEERWDEGC